MSIYQQLKFDDDCHLKSRNSRHASYPARFVVPDEKIKWEVSFDEYYPAEYNAPVVLNPQTPWADPHDLSLIEREWTSFEGKVQFNAIQRPINPRGRTGISGRGVLGKWGANFAVDAVITTINPQTNCFEVLTIKRRDTGETAFPGGMVDPGESPLATRNRELQEEISICLNDIALPLYEQVVFQGYVDDPRNTDNAWLETTAIHSHIAYDIASRMKLQAGDDAASVQWRALTTESIKQFYANHGYTLLRALSRMVEQYPSFINSEIQNQFKESFL